MHEVRSFAEQPGAIRTGPLAGLVPFNTASGFMHLIAITDCVLANVALKTPYGAASDTAVTLAGGRQLGQVKSFDLTSGQIQIISL